MSIVFECALKDYHFYTITHELEQQVYRLKQVHGETIINIANYENESTCGDGIIAEYDVDIPLCVLTADCLPVAVIGKEGVALIHAGWRGVENDISISKDIKDLDPEIFFIGPHIRECCFEVSSDFKDNFPNSNNFMEKGEKLYFSIEDELISRIKKAFPAAKTIMANECTCCDHKYFSFRRNKTSMRNWNLLLPKDNDTIFKNKL